VKQIATLGPKTWNKEMIEKLFLAGVDVFRLNLSHGAEDKVISCIGAACNIEYIVVAEVLHNVTTFTRNYGHVIPSAPLHFIYQPSLVYICG
jgi:hypothetical protein